MGLIRASLQNWTKSHISQVELILVSASTVTPAPKGFLCTHSFRGESAVEKAEIGFAIQVHRMQNTKLFSINYANLFSFLFINQLPVNRGRREGFIFLAKAQNLQL